jgi:hypothetical protein
MQVQQPSFRTYFKAIQSGVTCGVQRRPNMDGFLDFVLVVRLESTGKTICFHPESGAYNFDTFQEVQVPPTVFVALLQTLSPPRIQRVLPPAYSHECVEIITKVLSLLR